MPAQVGIELIGVEAVSAALGAGGEVARRVEAAVTEALAKCTEDLVGRAQRLAPVDEGTLRASGTAKVSKQGTALVGEVGFNTPYAEAQHERLDYRHQHGQAKYLETPLKQQAGRYRSLMEAAVGKALR